MVFSSMIRQPRSLTSVRNASMLDWSLFSSMKYFLSLYSICHRYLCISITKPGKIGDTLMCMPPPVGTGGRVEWTWGLVPVLLGMRFVSFTRPDESCGNEDRHKAPALLLIHPCPYRRGAKVSRYEPIRVSKFIKVCSAS